MSSEPASANILITKYLNERHCQTRIAILAELRASQQYLPISLSEHLLQLDLPLEEQQAIIGTTRSSNNLALEHLNAAAQIDGSGPTGEHATQLLDAYFPQR